MLQPTRRGGEVDRGVGRECRLEQRSIVKVHPGRVSVQCIRDLRPGEPVESRDAAPGALSRVPCGLKYSSPGPDAASRGGRCWVGDGRLEGGPRRAAARPTATSGVSARTTADRVTSLLDGFDELRGCCASVPNSSRSQHAARPEPLRRRIRGDRLGRRPGRNHHGAPRSGDGLDPAGNSRAEESPGPEHQPGRVAPGARHRGLAGHHGVTSGRGLRLGRLPPGSTRCPT